MKYQKLATSPRRKFIIIVIVSVLTILYFCYYIISYNTRMYILDLNAVNPNPVIKINENNSEFNYYVQSVLQKQTSPLLSNFDRVKCLEFWKLSLQLNLTSSWNPSLKSIISDLLDNKEQYLNASSYQISKEQSVTKNRTPITQVVLNQKILTMKNLAAAQSNLAKRNFRIYVGDFSAWPNWALNPEWKQAKAIQNNCPTLRPGQKCELLQEVEPTDWSEIDLIVTYSNQKLHRANTSIPWLKFILEASYYEPVVTSNEEDMLNSAMITYHRSSPIAAPYASWIYYDPNVTLNNESRADFSQGKTAMAAILVSNCHAYNGRLEYVTELQKYVQVDVYGACGTFTCVDNCLEHIKKKYWFYLAFENSNCQDYITEKLFYNPDGMVPIVMGAPPDDYKAYAPANSYIHVQDFASPRHLAQYMIFLTQNPAMYNRYFEWVGLGEYITTMYPFCTLCSLGIANPNYYREELELKMIQWSPDTIYNGKRLCLERNKWYWD